MSSRMKSPTRFQSLSILALVLLGGFTILIVFDVDIEEEISNLGLDLEDPPEPRIVEIEKIELMFFVKNNVDRNTAISMVIVDKNGINVNWDFYLIPEYSYYLLEEDFFLANGTDKIFWGNTSFGYYFIWGKQNFNGEWNFYENLYMLDLNVFEFDNILESITRTYWKALLEFDNILESITRHQTFSRSTSIGFSN